VRVSKLWSISFLFSLFFSLLVWICLRLKSY
jgi:hypothetical protein